MRKLCDLHISIFKEQMEKQQSNLQSLQPISILMEEHKTMMKLTDQLVAAANKVLEFRDMQYVTAEIHEVEHIPEDFTDSEKYYLREENVLLQYTEKHVITEPPTVIWMEHNEMRELKKKLHALIKVRALSNLLCQKKMGAISRSRLPLL